MSFGLALAIVAFAAGAISSVAGFGIGSILTPLFGLGLDDVKLGVAAAAVPHFVGNALRLWTLRKRVDTGVLKTFGLFSAAGALLGALLHAVAATPALKIVLAIVLIVTGALGAAGWTDRLRVGLRGASVAGAASGFLGGLVGYQGGLRASAMLALDVRKEVFVATAVAIALVVDGARLPIYAFSVGPKLVVMWPLLFIAVAGVSGGTLLGKALLGRIPEAIFRRIVSALILVLGLAMLISR
jgi:uncharacterized protein